MGCFVHRFLISSPNLRIDTGFSLFPPYFVHRFLISGPDLRIDAGISPFTPSFVHRFLISGPDLRITAGFCLGMVSPATGIEDAGGDWYHEGGIILSKKPPEWHLSPPLHLVSLRPNPAPPSRSAAVHLSWRYKKIRPTDCRPFWYWVGESNSYCEIENLEY